MKISITLPVYNEKKNINHALNALTNQTYKNLEILVCDDKSTDNSIKVIKKYSKNDKRITAFFNSKNIGCEKTFKMLFKNVSGELFYGAAADDYIIDNRFFEKVVHAFKKFPSAGGYCAKTGVIDRSTEKKLWVMGSCEKTGFNESHRVIKAFFDNKLFIPGTSSVWKKDLIDEIGGYDFRLGPQADYFVNHIIPFKHGIYFADEEVAIMRKSKTSYSAQVKNAEFFMRHALFEKKAKKFLGQHAPSSSMWFQWRKSLINARLDIELNRAVSNGIEKSLKIIHEWEKDALAPYLKKISKIYFQLSAPFDHWLQSQEKQAIAIFEKIAGPINTLVLEDQKNEKKSIRNTIYLKLRGFLK